MNKEKSHYNDDLRKLTSFNDPSGLTVEQIQRKLVEEDPSMFRQLMQDLKVTGDEPDWLKKDLYDKFTEVKDDTLAGIKKEYQKIKKEKNVMASEIQRTQDLLKQVVDIDKEKTLMLSLEIKHLKDKIQIDKDYQDQLASQYSQKSDLIQKYKNDLKINGDKYLSKDALKQLDGIDHSKGMDMDIMSEFSGLTEQDDILPGENILDLRVSQGDFDRQMINRIFGLKESMP